MSLDSRLDDVACRLVNGKTCYGGGCDRGPILLQGRPLLIFLVVVTHVSRGNRNLRLVLGPCVSAVEAELCGVVAELFEAALDQQLLEHNDIASIGLVDGGGDITNKWDNANTGICCHVEVHFGLGPLVEAAVDLLGLFNSFHSEPEVDDDAEAIVSVMRERSCGSRIRTLE